MVDSVDGPTLPPQDENMETQTVEGEANDEDDDQVEQDWGTESSDSEPRCSGPSGVLLKAFSKLTRKYSFSLNQTFCSSEPDLTIDQLEEKVELVNQIRTSLLPSIKTQLATLLQSLDLSEHPIHLCPDQESTVKILSELGVLLNKTRSAVENIALQPPLPSADHDHHLQELKIFRSHHLLWKTKAIIQNHLCEILSMCESYIVTWERAENERVDVKYQMSASKMRMEIAQMLASCGDRIDGLIEWAHLSDFAMLQREWRVSSRKVDRMLQALVEIINGTYSRPGSEATPTDGQGDRAINEEHRARSIELARSAMSILKLARLFYDKLSKTTTQKIPFTSNPGICSRQIDALRDITQSFDEKIEHLTGHFCVIYETDENLERKIESLTSVTFQASSCLEEALLTLAFHLKPSNSRGYHYTTQCNFKTWFLLLERLFRVACFNLKQTINSCFPEVQSQEDESDQA